MRSRRIEEVSPLWLLLTVVMAGSVESIDLDAGGKSHFIDRKV